MNLNPFSSTNTNAPLSADKGAFADGHCKLASELRRSQNHFGSSQRGFESHTLRHKSPQKRNVFEDFLCCFDINLRSSIRRSHAMEQKYSKKRVRKSVRIAPKPPRHMKRKYRYEFYNFRKTIFGLISFFPSDTTEQLLICSSFRSIIKDKREGFL